MRFTEDTRLSEIIELCPELPAYIAAREPKYAVINSPLGRKLAGRFTVKDLSAQLGLGVEELFQKLIRAFPEMKEFIE